MAISVIAGSIARGKQIAYLASASTVAELTDVAGDTSMNAGSFLRVSPVP